MPDPARGKQKCPIASPVACSLGEPPPQLWVEFWLLSQHHSPPRGQCRHVPLPLHKCGSSGCLRPPPCIPCPHQGRAEPLHPARWWFLEGRPGWQEQAARYSGIRA